MLKKNIISIICCALLLMFPINMKAQLAFVSTNADLEKSTSVINQNLQDSQPKKNLEGVITDANGEPIIGATVKIKNMTIGTTTDINGRYTLSNVPLTSIITITFVGYQSIELPADSPQLANIILQEDYKALDELVVVGYGTMRKSDLTGAVTAVKAAEAFKSTPSSNISNALQGRMAGVSVVSGGDPSKDMTIRVRGINSINAETGPLVVIDGFIGGNLKDLNPGDIQSVEVLKDASATAVYGARGANGVILVTTKQIDKEKLSVDFNAFVDFKTVLKYPESLTPGQFARLANDYGREFFPTDGKPVKVYYTDAEIADFDSGKRGYDYIRNIFNDPAFSQNYDLSLQGKSGKISFLASTRYEKAQGVIRNSNFDQFNWRLKLDVDLRKWVTTGLNFWGNYKQNEGPRLTQYEGLLIMASQFANTVEPMDANGNYNNMFPIQGLAAYNPMGHINEMDENNKQLNSNLQGYIDFKILDGLSFRSQIGVNFVNRLGLNLNTEKSYYFFKNAHTQATAYSRWTTGWLNSNILSYVKEFNQKHRINATAVFEQSFNDMYNHTSEATMLAFDDIIGYNGLDWADNFKAKSYREIETLISGMLRINYVFANRYMFTGSLRADASSNLAEKWDYFPSFAVAWDMKQESFMRNVNWIDQMKLRIGYGSVGNQAIQPYRIYSQMVPVQNPDGTTSYAIGRPKASYLRWERNDQTNIGLDMSFLNSKYTLGIDVYNKVSDNILLEVAQPVHTSWPDLLKNAGAIQNKGIEATLGANLLSTADFNWQTTLTLTHNKGTFKKIPTPTGMQNQSGEYENQIFKMIEGEKLGTFWGYYYDGVWKTDDMNKPVTNPDGTQVLKADNTPYTYQEYYGVAPGMAKYVDVNMDGKIDQNDQGIIGNGQPQFNWGWNHSLNYRDFDFSLFIVGYHGFEIYNATRAISYGTVNGQAVDVITPNPELLNRWTPQNEDTDIPGFVKDLKPLRGFSDRFVEKGDFVKIKNITLGYSLNKNITKKLEINNLRLYVSIQNPFHFTGYKGLDPEAALGAPLTQGVDWGAYPNGRNYMIGINFSF